MPIKPADILALLTTKRDDFSQFDRTTLSQLKLYREAWLKLAGALQQGDIAVPQGEAVAAKLIEPFKETKQGILVSHLCWQSREQSLDWVRDRLLGISTFAVDGSQVFPSKDLSIPVALVQIGWFENPHLPTGDYEKDIRVDVLTPSDLKPQQGLEPVDRRVNMRRFQMETERLIEYMAAHPNAKDCLTFFDGSLIATFAEAMDAEARQVYVSCLLNLLDASQQQQVPLVAYIDTTYAKDLVGLVQHQYDLNDAAGIHDAQLLHPFMQWGDRTPFALCQRSGILSSYGDQKRQIGFTYLKAHDGYPVRLEIPLWVYQAGYLNQIIDWVRGEIIIGNGYPYVLETADQVAVLQSDDRKVFYRLFQDWAEQEDLQLRLSRKMVSKARRR